MVQLTMQVSDELAKQLQPSTDCRTTKAGALIVIRLASGFTPTCRITRK